MSCPAPLFKTINHLRHLRRQHLLTQKELADFVGVSKNTISNIECGNFNPSLELSARLCFALGVDFEDLFSFEFHRSDGDVVIYKF